MTMVSPQPESSQSRSQDVASVAESSGSPEKDAATIAEKDDEAERTKDKERGQLTEKDAIALEEEQDEWEHDPANPLTWTSRKKWRMTAIVSLYTFVSPLASSMMAPALPDIAEHFGITNETIVSLTLSIFLLSLAISPLIYAPLSEMYGRIWVLHLNNLAFLAFNLGCAFAPTTGALIGLRFLSGWVGSAPLAVGGGVVQDLFSPHDRAMAMSMYSMGPLIGPVVGPIAGGFIAETIGFKYIFIVIVGITAVAAIVGIPFLRETYAPVIRYRLMKKKDPEEARRLSAVILADHGNKWDLLWTNLTRPFVMLSHSLICFMLSLFMALEYGIYYLMFTTFPTLFSDVYHFSIGISGLAYIGLGVGFMSATLASAHIGNTIYAKLSTANGGKGKPEFRVPALIAGSFFVPVGLFWYGWSAQAGVHWIMPIIGTGIFGAGLMATYLPIQLYLVDAFQYGASALSAAAVSRSIVGFAFPLFGEQMFDRLGYGGGNSLLAGLAIVLGIPFPIWLWFYGEKMRMKSALTR